MNYPERRIFEPDPDLIHTLNPDCLPWIGKQVTVRSWHSNVSMRELFPHVELVGYVEEFGRDIPKSELK